MTQIDSATQQKAAASEHASTSSHEMQEQSEVVKDLVDNLQRMIAGGS